MDEQPQDKLASRALVVVAPVGLGSHGVALRNAAEPALGGKIGYAMAENTEVRFKYRERLRACSEQPCPSERYQERDCTGFRWAHNPPRANDFEPPAIAYQYGPTACGSYALSFFKTHKHARRRWLDLIERGIDAEQIHGTLAVEIDLKRDDGRCSLPSRTWKHFDLHEYDRDHVWLTRIKNRHLMKEEV